MIAEYTSHFAHEEALLDEHLYGGDKGGGADASPAGGSGGFSVASSMRASHWGDHKAMLNELAALDAALGERAAAAGGGPGGALLAAAEVDAVLRRFEKHADLYDGSYAAPLSEKLAVAVGVH